VLSRSVFFHVGQQLVVTSFLFWLNDVDSPMDENILLLVPGRTLASRIDCFNVVCTADESCCHQYCPVRSSVRLS
jgi:hypothetical protein